MGTGVLGGALFVGGSIKQHREQRKARNEQREIAQKQEAANQATASQARTSAAREERMKRARVLQMSENMGVAGSSVESSATGALSAGLRGVAAQQGFATATSQGFSESQQRLANIDNRIRTASQVTQIGQSLFNSSVSSIFKMGGAG